MKHILSDYTIHNTAGCISVLQFQLNCLGRANQFVKKILKNNRNPLDLTSLKVYSKLDVSEHILDIHSDPHTKVLETLIETENIIFIV